VGVSESRARPLGGQALHHHVSVSYLALVRGYRLLNRAEASRVVQEAPANITFLMPKQDAEQILFRVLTPSPYTDPRAGARGTQNWDRKYVWTVFSRRDRGYLITTELARKGALTAAFKRAKLYGRGFVLRLELVPSIENIQEFSNAGA